MKIGAVIAEYNPFHKGHAYQLARFREECSLDCVIVIMSGCFVQRGEPAVNDKYTRARWALSNGADAVIELPVYYSLSNAENFARGAVASLAGVADVLGFGAETDDISLLQRAADIDISSVRDNESGKSYPRAVHEFVAEKYGAEIAEIYSSPNSTLALEYIRAIRNICPDTAIHVTKRRGDTHDGNYSGGEYASASAIRELIRRGEDVTALVPEGVEAKIKVTLSDMDRLLLYNLRNMPASELAGICDVSEGLENLIKREAERVTSYAELLCAVKTKRYTMARLKRIGLCALFGITGNMSASKPEYLHVLGVRDNIRETLLPELERRSTLKILAKGKDYKSYTENARALTKTDLFATNAYCMFCDELPNVDFSNKLLII